MGALAALISSACISAAVSYTAPLDPGAPHIPWLSAGPVSGYLFYYGADGPWREKPERVIITTGGGPAGGFATKILWHVRGGAATLRLTGRRLDGSGRFTQTFPAIGGGFFPSTVVVPAPGCWGVTVRSGHRVRRFAFLALAP